MKRKPNIGETLFDLNIGNHARNRPQSLTPVKVTKIGRKFFTCAPFGSNHETEFHLDTWAEKTEHCRNHQLYETREAWEEEDERQRLSDRIKQAFNKHGEIKLPLAQMGKIDAILSEYGL